MDNQRLKINPYALSLWISQCKLVGNKQYFQVSMTVHFLFWCYKGFLSFELWLAILWWHHAYLGALCVPSVVWQRELIMIIDKETWKVIFGTSKSIAPRGQRIQNYDARLNSPFHKGVCHKAEREYTAQWRFNALSTQNLQRPATCGIRDFGGKYV